MGNEHISRTPANVKIAALTVGVACCLAYVVFKLAPDIMAYYRRDYRKRSPKGGSEVAGMRDEPCPGKAERKGVVSESQVDGQRQPEQHREQREHTQSQPPALAAERETIVRDPTLEYPFLTDPETIKYIGASKVMFIMRGLPGSGKSVVAEVIRETYDNSVICCADDFRMVNGKYVFIPEKLKDDHAKCHARAKESCEKGINVVVIDNTNVRAWEMQYYLDLARKTNYTVVLVEPKTPWKCNPYELAQKNKHGVQFSVLQKKVESFETMIPYFFGWFLNDNNSRKIRLVGNRVYRELQQKADFVEAFKTCVLGDPDARLNFNTFYSADTFSVGPHMLHCTAKFCGRGKVPNSYRYLKNSDVQASLGETFTTHIIGFFFTARTFGTRLRLTPQQVKLWGQEDEKHHVVATEARINQCMSAGSGRRGAGPIPAYELRGTGFDGPVMTWEKRGGHLPKKMCDNTNRFQPTSGIGSRSHLTIGCARGVKAVQTGIDLVDIIQMEQEAEELREANVTMSLQLKDGQLRCYDNKAWVVYLNEPIIVGSLFSGFY